MISSTLYFLLIELNYHLPYSLFKSDWFTHHLSQTRSVLYILSVYNYHLSGLAHFECLVHVN